MALTSVFRLACALVLFGLTYEFDPDSVPNLPRKTKTKYSAVPEEARFLKCEACQKALRNLYHDVADARAARKKRKLDEETIQTMVEETCLPLSRGGDWIVRTDLVQENGGPLQIVETPTLSRCKSECETVARSCHDTVGEVDTDIAELLYENELSLSQLINKVCWEMTDACKRKRSLTKPHKEEKRQEMSEKERSMFLMVEEMNMKNPMGGQKMSLYSREDLERSLGGKPEAEEEEGVESKKTTFDDEVDLEWDLPPNDWVGWTVYKIHKGISWFGKLFYDPSRPESEL